MKILQNKTIELKKMRQTNGKSKFMNKKKKEQLNENEN